MMRRFLRWLRARRLRASIVDYQRNLDEIRALRAHCDTAEAIIMAAMTRDQVAHYHATRKELK